MDAQNPGRPSVYSESIGDAICAAVEEHGSVALGAEAAGVHRNTVANWRQREDEPYASFATRLMVARARYVARRKRGLHESDDWRAIAWELERLERQEFARPAPPGVVREQSLVQPARPYLSDEVADQIRRKILYGEREPREPGRSRD